MLPQWRVVGNTVFGLTGPRFKPQTSRSRDERVSARPTARSLLISTPPKFSVMPRFETINFYQNKPKIKLLLQKNNIFRELRAPPLDPQWPPEGRGEVPKHRKQLLPLSQISGYAPDTKRVLLILPSFRILQ